jgi:hypothetical protein
MTRLKGISELVIASALIAAALIGGLLVATIIYPSLGIWQESTISIRLGGVSSYYVGSNRIYYIATLYTAPTSPVYVNIVNIVITNKYASQISIAIDGSLAGLGSYGSWLPIGSVYVLNKADVCISSINRYQIDPGRSIVISLCILTAGGPLPQGLTSVKILCSGCDRAEYFVKI